MPAALSRSLIRFNPIEHEFEVKGFWVYWVAAPPSKLNPKYLFFSYSKLKLYNKKISGKIYPNLRLFAA